MKTSNRIPGGRRRYVVKRKKPVSKFEQQKKASQSKIAQDISNGLIFVGVMEEPKGIIQEGEKIGLAHGERKSSKRDSDDEREE